MKVSETIEKLNDALTQLIEAHGVLQERNEHLENKNQEKDKTISLLEDKLANLNGDTVLQTDKMDGMLNRIQTLLTPMSDENSVVQEKEKIETNIASDNIFDIKIPVKEIEDEKVDTKIDLGRMESLLNGINKK